MPNYTSSMKTFLRLGLIISCVVVVLGVFVIPTSVGAETKTTLGINGGDSFLKEVAGQTGISMEEKDGLQVGVGLIIERALQIVGSIFLLLMIYAGFLWFVARDDETQAKKAKDTGTMAAIGLIIILLSYAVTSLIINQAKAPDASKAGELGCCMDYIGVEYGYDIGWSCSTKTATECKQTAEVCTEADNYTNFEFKAGTTGAKCVQLCAQPKTGPPSSLIDCRD